jgi:multiple sugar transport system substrate-binding protein
MRKSVIYFIIPLLLISFLLLFIASKEEKAVEKKIQVTSEWGDYSGITLQCKFIGGQMYEYLYERIPIWEQKTGAKVVILSKKNHFDIDREMKQDIAAGTVSWDVGTNHSSFAPSYGDTFIDLYEYVPRDYFSVFAPRSIENCTVNGKLVEVPRHGDVSNLYYIKSVFADPENKRKFKAKYGYELKPPETYDQFKDMAIFLSKPPDFYGTQYVGKDEPIVGRFYEMLVANGGRLFDEKWHPAFNSKEGLKTLQWFIDLYNAKAVPPGVLNYLWGDTGMGFASGTVALNMDWGGWAAFFNDPENSKIAGDVGFVRAPKGDAGIRSGWSGWHSFSVTKNSKNKAAAIAFILFLTNYDSQMVEGQVSHLPSRTKVVQDLIAQFKAQGNQYLADMYKVWGAALAEDAFTPPLIPEWPEFANILYPELQAAILGDKTPQQALADATKTTDQLMRDAGYY